jgi:hypothetical protein
LSFAIKRLDLINGESRTEENNGDQAARPISTG